MFLGDEDPTRAPRIGARSELALGAVFLGVALVLGVVDLAGGVSSWLSGGGFRLVGLTSAAQFFGHMLIRPSRAGAAWPPDHRAFHASLFFVVLGLVVTVPALGSALVVRHLRGRHGPPRDHGFASRSAVRAVATFEAASARVAQTRPSLLDSAASKNSANRTLRAADVGYSLGYTRRPKGIELIANWECSLQLVAPSSSGKTLRVLTRALRQHPGPALATSTKPDLYEFTAAARERVGPVFALDPEGNAPAAEPVRWSPVLGCTDTRVAERRAAALIAANGEAGDLRSGAFFKQSATVVLAAYLHAAALSGASMTDVARWSARPSDPAPLRILSESSDAGASWAARLAEHTTGAAETTSGVMRSVDLALGCFRHQEVVDLCSPAPGDEIDLDAVLAENGTLYALGKHRNIGSIGVGPLITAFCEELVLIAEQRATAQPGRRLDPPLLALLDEAPSIAPLPGLPALVADGRGRGITVVIAMQSLSQAIERWGRTGAATMRNASTITAVFGGLTIAEDLDELSRLCGTRKVVRHSATEDTARDHHSIGASWADEPVLTAADIRELPPGVALLLWGSLPPILSYVPGTWEGEDAAMIASDEREVRERNDSVRALEVS
jgi:hypothetical protein